MTSKKCQNIFSFFSSIFHISVPSPVAYHTRFFQKLNTKKTAFAAFCCFYLHFCFLFMITAAAMAPADAPANASLAVIPVLSPVFGTEVLPDSEVLLSAADTTDALFPDDALTYDALCGEVFCVPAAVSFFVLLLSRSVCSAVLLPDPVFFPSDCEDPSPGCSSFPSGLPELLSELALSSLCSESFSPCFAGSSPGACGSFVLLPSGSFTGSS